MQLSWQEQMEDDADRLFKDFLFNQKSGLHTGVLIPMWGCARG